MTFKGGKESRATIKKETGDAAVELPILGFSVNPGAAKRIEFVHSKSDGGTDIDTGIKSAPTARIPIEYDLDNDPFGSDLNLKGGEKIAEIRLYPFGGTGETPTGPYHKLLIAQVEDSPFDDTVDGKPALQISVACSTRNYDYIEA